MRENGSGRERPGAGENKGEKKGVMRGGASEREEERKRKGKRVNYTGIRGRERD